MWINQKYIPNATSKTVYFANHNMWWDGLLPLFLSRKVFKQNARAFMEDKQMQKYSFFSKIGAFSVDLSNPRSALRSLRFAVDSMNRSSPCLFIYPEGELTPVLNAKPVFQNGLAWLYQNMDSNVDFVPIAFYSHIFRDSKPELYIYIGEAMKLDAKLSKNELTAEFEQAVLRLLVETRKVAGFSDSGFMKI